MSKAIAVAYCLHDDAYYLAESIQSVNCQKSIATLAYVSRIPWNGQPGDWEQAAAIARTAGAEVVGGDWRSELEQRQAVMADLARRGFDYAVIPDGDEILEVALVRSLLAAASAGLAERVYCEWDTYWKSPEYVIRPRERFTPCILVDVRQATPTGGRSFEGGRPLFLSSEHGIIHHLSYVGPDARILRKISTWGHTHEVVPGWLDRVWKGWDRDRLMRGLHPTHPSAYGFAERIAVRPELEPAHERYLELAGTDAQRTTYPPSSATGTKGGDISIVIPVHGGKEDLAACLNSLSKCCDLFDDVIVVDDASTDGAADEVEPYGFARVIRLEANRGFAHACNVGFHAGAAPLVLFLNSDTVVPRAGLVSLIDSLQSSGTVAMAGPYTNRAGHGQQIDPTCTSMDTLGLFAEDFSAREETDVERDMLVGFCLLARRSALMEVMENGRVFDERFGLGTFEDNDLCYRLRRAGYRLLLAARAFTHHGGSKTLIRVAPNVSALLAENERLFREKWRRDVSCGFSTGLSGLSREAITFQRDQSPELLDQRMRAKAKQAGISLVMIVKNEERVLADALESARPWFTKMVVVDTGSTDRTVEIAEAAGAEVYHFPWTDSFAEARNESLKHAKSKWLFWLDADDTLPWESGAEIVEAALGAPPEVVAFVVPVQFVEDGSNMGRQVSGTRVDHVKLIRNLPGLQFEGRIHEQILPSIRKVAPHGQVARSSAVVLHSGYDTSDEGQARKRVRDYRLLDLDLAERPNHPFVLFCYGMTDHYCGRHEEAISRLKRCIEVSSPDLTHLRKAYPLLANSLRDLGQLAESVAALEQGLAVVGEDPEMRFHLGLLKTSEEKLEEAREQYLKALAVDVADYFSSVDIGILGYKTFHNLAGVCQALGRYAEARDWWRRAIEDAPQFTPSAFELFDAALAAEDFPTAREAADHVRQAEGESANWMKMSMRYAEKVGGKSNVLAHLEHLAGSSGSPWARLELGRRLMECGDEGRAGAILAGLSDEGVAEAAFFLGVARTRHGDLPGALSWMEWALQLNPSHEPTREQVANLRRALGTSSAHSEQVMLEEALGLAARTLGLNHRELVGFVEENLVGGFNLPESPSPNRRWPGGSIWEDEGKLLYALVRALRPKVVAEVGSLIGCSTSHLAAACRANGVGKVYAVDPAGDFSSVDPELLPFIEPVREDVFSWTGQNRIDFLFEDGSHEPGFTRAVLGRLLPKLSKGGIACCHDYFTAHLPHVRAEFEAAVKAHGMRAAGFLPGDSDCGIGIARRRVQTQKRGWKGSKKDS